jgi:23S rRNA (guanine745-N1)-methyltransferase
VDIAKAGIRLAAKSDLVSTYAVASSHALPLASESMEIITRIYAPSKDEELARVLHPQGRLIIVTPGERHLLRLREQIYQRIRPHPQPVAPRGFSPLEVHRVSYELNVAAGEHAMALLQMTPFAWKLSDSLREQCRQVGLVDDADFQIAIYQKAAH